MVYRERSSYNLPYQKQAQSTFLSLRMSKLFRILALLLVIILFFVTFPNIYRDIYNIPAKPLTNIINKNKGQNDIVVVVDGEKQALSLRPIFCQLSTRKNINTHVIVTGQGRGLSRSLLTRLINEQKYPCEVLIYDLEIKTNNEMSVSESVFHGIGHILNQIQPDALLYVKNQENSAMRGVGSALFAASHLGITEISVPIEDVENLVWLSRLSIESIKNWNKPKIHIQVITQDRPDSLARLIRSLNVSHYFGDEITLTINMDRGADPVTKEYCRKLEWPFGQKNLRHRIVQGGLMAAVVESYYPNDDDEYAVLLEDDIELSPHFYTWTKYNILKYRYGADRNYSSRMYGISYYGSKIDELYLSGRRPFDPATSLEGTNYSSRSPFLWQLPCSWGAVYFPEIWREFHEYLTDRMKDLEGINFQNITVPETRSNRWTKSWKRFLIELIYIRGYVMLYPNYENYTSFSTNHAEAGIHIHPIGGRSQEHVFGVPLMERDIILSGLPGGDAPDYVDLPILDLVGNLISKEESIQRGRALQSEVSLCPPSDELTFNPQDILCVNETKKSIAMNETKTLENRNNLISQAVNIIANHTLDSNDTVIDAEKLLGIVLKLYDPSLIDDSSNSTQTQALSIETNVKS